MTQDEIIEMARQTLLASWHKDLKKWQIEQGVEAFAKLVAEREREACAKVCEEHGKVWAERFLLGYQATLDDAADAIRARSSSRGEA
jgi:hypothetical protein